MSDTWRVFCAIDLPSDLKQKLANHISHLRQATGVKAGWTRTDNIHLTIKFLGETPMSLVEKLTLAAARAVKPLAPFKVTVEHCGVFPPHGPPRVLWVGITDAGNHLARLHQRLEEECQAAGFPKESRPFHPHLTVARIRHSSDARSLGAAHRALDFEPAEIDVTELLVIRSELGPDGSKYSPVSKHVLSST